MEMCLLEEMLCNDFYIQEDELYVKPAGSRNSLQNIEQVMILFDDGDELILRDGAVTVQIQPVEQLLGLRLVRLASDHLVDSEDCSVLFLI